MLLNSVGRSARTIYQWLTANEVNVSACSLRERQMLVTKGESDGLSSNTNFTTQHLIYPDRGFKQDVGGSAAQMSGVLCPWIRPPILSHSEGAFHPDERLVMYRSQLKRFAARSRRFIAGVPSSNFNRARMWRAAHHNGRKTAHSTNPIFKGKDTEPLLAWIDLGEQMS